jgi:catechol 2,3-dioxygenase-like lactoylglutathione lyase family enzyme
MRLDHVAYRVKDREKTAKFFIDALGYTIQERFTIDFDDGTCAECIALEPPEKLPGSPPWICGESHHFELNAERKFGLQIYHMPPEIFVSDGAPGSIVGDWVAARGGIGGIHHMAYQVDDVEAKMKEWQEKGYAEFSSDKPMICPEDKLIQIFTKPIDVIGGIVYEFIERSGHGFCNKNVKALMESSKNS